MHVHRYRDSSHFVYVENNFGNVYALKYRSIPIFILGEIGGWIMI